MSIDDPLQALFAFFWLTRPAPNSTEEAREPFDVVMGPGGSLLALSVFERTRELGLLRAVGMTRQQLRSSIRWEAILIALLGTVVGIGLPLLRYMFAELGVAWPYLWRLFPAPSETTG